MLQQCLSSLSDRKQRWQELELPVVPLFERNSTSRTGQPRTFWLRGAARKQRETRRRGRWNIGERFPEWWWWHSIFRTRGWFLPRKVNFYLWKKYSLQRQNCVQLIFFLSPLLWNYGIAVTFWVLCTCWNFYSFLWYWPACTYKFVRDRSLMKGSTVTSLRYSCKTLKTSKSWIMILLKRNKLTPYGDYRLQRINAGWENHHPPERLFSV